MATKEKISSFWIQFSERSVSVQLLRQIKYPVGISPWRFTVANGKGKGKGFKGGGRGGRFGGRGGQYSAAESVEDLSLLQEEPVAVADEDAGDGQHITDDYDGWNAWEWFFVQTDVRSV